MPKQLQTERLYTLGDYQNIKFSITTSDIPDELATNPEAIGKLYYEQMVSCDIAYLEYKQLRETLAKSKVEDVLAKLKEEREHTMEDLYKLQHETAE